MKKKAKETSLGNESLCIIGGGGSGIVVGGLMLRGCESKVFTQVNTDAGKAVFLCFLSVFYALSAPSQISFAIVLWAINLVLPHKLTRHFNSNSKVASSVLSNSDGSLYMNVTNYSDRQPVNINSYNVTKQQGTIWTFCSPKVGHLIPFVQVSMLTEFKSALGLKERTFLIGHL